MLASIAMIVIYIFLYILTWGADFLTQFTRVLPWFMKGTNIFLFPFFLGAYLFILLFSSLTLWQIFKNKNQSSLTAIIALPLFLLILFISFTLLTQWINDQRFLYNRLLYQSLSNNSSDPQVLQKLFKTAASSHDPDVNYQLAIIPMIAGNQHSPAALLIDIYHYALTLKDDSKRLLILDYLKRNPNAPSDILSTPIPTPRYGR